MLTPGADPVRKISIIPRTMSLGVTLSAPDADRFNYDKQGLLAHIKVAAGGRAAEEVVYGDETTGAESDIRQATSLARNMVGRFGMSDEIGFLSVLPQNGEGSGLQGYSDVSERTRQRIDDEMRRIVGEAHDDAVQLLADNRERLESLAQALLRAETLEGPEAYAAAGLQPPAALRPRQNPRPSPRHEAGHPRRNRQRRPRARHAGARGRPRGHGARPRAAQARRDRRPRCARPRRRHERRRREARREGKRRSPQRARPRQGSASCAITASRPA
jgi:Peptidase family M41